MDNRYENRMGHKLIIMVLICLTIPLTAAFEIDSNTYTAFNYHTGLGASTGNSTTYDLRDTITIQGYNNEMSSSSYTAKSGIYKQTDLIAPVIALDTPENGSTVTSGSVIFIYNVTDDNPILFCELYINEIFITNNTAVTGSNTYLRNSNNGDFNWTISCSDIFGNTANETGYYTVEAGTGGGGGGSISPPAEEDIDVNRLIESIGLVGDDTRDFNLKVLIFLAIIYIYWLLFIVGRRKKKAVAKAARNVIVR